MSFLRLLVFVLRLRFINGYSGKPKKWIWLILAILYVLFQAAIAILMLGFADHSGSSGSLFVGIINFSFMFLLVAVHFFPTYHTTSMPIWPFHPMKQWQRGLFALVCDVLTLAPILAAVFVLLLLLSPHYGSKDFLFSALLLVVIVMSDRSVRLVLDYHFDHKLAYITVAVALLLAPFAVSYLLIRRGEYLWLPLTFLAIFAVLVQSFLSFRSATGCPAVGVQNSVRLTAGMGTHIKSMVFQLSLLPFRVPLMRRSFFLLFLGKVFPLLFFAKFMQKSEHVQYFQIMLFVAGSPAVLFNNLFNNLFGHSIALWDSLRLHSMAKNGLLWVYLQLMLLPLLLDAVFTLTVMGSAGLLDFWFLLFYVGLLPVFITIGYLGSLMKARLVKPVSFLISLRNPTSPMLSVLTVMLAGVFAVAFNMSHTLLVILVLLSVLSFVVTISLKHSFWHACWYKAQVTLHS